MGGRAGKTGQDEKILVKEVKDVPYRATMKSREVIWGSKGEYTVVTVENANGEWKLYSFTPVPNIPAGTPVVFEAKKNKKGVWVIENIRADKQQTGKKTTDDRKEKAFITASALVKSLIETGKLTNLEDSLVALETAAREICGMYERITVAEENPPDMDIDG